MYPHAYILLILVIAQTFLLPQATSLREDEDLFLKQILQPNPENQRRLQKRQVRRGPFKENDLGLLQVLQPITKTPNQTKRKQTRDYIPEKLVNILNADNILEESMDKKITS
ncbi:hypothetical protein JTE90_012532 [Oedothorax gibbosus]|uniref:Uncharacterized protein n=1 Tax=Oedothorax gibbosus TaxID=931172 RepID=A0AAV6U5K7_9ARAC|nr:hypothetical protein JTE90_012532 [Oedothorax gibbosus]